MKTSIDHPTSSYGIPVILDDSGNPMDYADGFRAARVKLGLTAAALGAKLNVSERTINGWEQGRPVTDIAALNMLGKLLRSHR